jgi:hypothetical protein
MPKIYRNVYINIAAEWATSSEEGLFRLRNPLLLQSHVVFLKDEDNREESYTLYAEGFEELNPNLNAAQLQIRGWVFQERMLSPRIVHFSREQLWWECSRSANTCEKRPRGNLGEQRPHHGMTGVPGRIQSDRSASGADLARLCNQDLVEPERLPWLSRLLMFKKKPQELNQQMVQSTLEYFGLIEKYTARQLTYPDSDKLPAFGAIAGNYAKVFNSRYLAGCFEQHFPACLAWRIKDGHPTPKPDTADHQRPSWSWISSDSPVKFECGLSYLDRYGGGYAALAAITAVRLDLTDGRNAFGQVQRAKLTLNTRLLPYRYVPPRRGLPERGLGPDIDILVTGDSSLLIETERGPKLQVLYTTPDGRTYIHKIEDNLGEKLLFDDGVVPQDGTEAMRVALLDVTLLSERARLATAGAEGGYMVICGLIVRPVQTLSGVRFRRVGVWEERLPHGDEKLEVYTGLPRESIVLI